MVFTTEIYFLSVIINRAETLTRVRMHLQPQQCVASREKLLKFWGLDRSYWISVIRFIPAHRATATTPKKKVINVRCIIKTEKRLSPGGEQGERRTNVCHSAALHMLMPFSFYERNPCRSLTVLIHWWNICNLLNWSLNCWWVSSVPVVFIFYIREINELCFCLAACRTLMSVCILSE